MTSAFPTVSFDKFAGRSDDYMFTDSENVSRSLKDVGFVILGPCRWGRIDHDNSSPNVLMFALPRIIPHRKEDRICNIKIKKFLANRGINISIGSACNTNKDEPSHVLTSLTAPFVILSSVCRISMHDKTTLGELQKLVRTLKDAVRDQLF